MRTFILAIVLAIGLGACAGTQVQTPRQGVAACYATVKTTWSVAGDLKVRGQLAPDQQKAILAMGDQALASCDAAAVALSAGDLSTAESKLKLAESVLLKLEQWQLEKGGK